MIASRSQITALLVLVLLASGAALNLNAGGYIFSRNNGENSITHVHGYTGSGGNLIVTVAIDPNTLHRDEMITAVRNVISILNGLEPTNNNVVLGGGNNVPSNAIDFESVLLHEMGHSIGLSHTNQGAEVINVLSDFTNVHPGNNGNFDFDPGNDGVIGSADDERGDDINLIWFRMSDNNPFLIGSTVDITTYSRDVADLPGSDLFPNQASRQVAQLILGNDDTESIMNQGSFNDEAQRFLMADDVATLRLALAGLDRTQGTADDHTYTLQFIGFAASQSLGSGPDIVIDFDDSETGFAVSKSSGLVIAADQFALNGSNVFFNDGFTWFFNDTFTTDDCWDVFFIDQPVGADLCSGANHTLTVNASVTNPQYQWLKDGDEVPGATSATLNLTDVTSADAGSYTCQISNDCDTQISQAAVVNVGGGITAQPESQSACPGDNVSFSVTAADGAATFQWRKNGVNIIGATAATLTLTAITTNDLATYSCAVTDGCGTTVSNNAVLSVGSNISITGQPTGTTICAGESFSLQVTVSGPATGFQWRLNDTDIAGATAASLTVNGAVTTDAGSYTCAVASDCGVVVSSAAQVNITSPAYDKANLPLWRTSVSAGDCLDANTDGIIDIRDLVQSVNALP